MTVPTTARKALGVVALVAMLTGASCVPPPAPPPSSARQVECTGLKGPRFDCELNASSFPSTASSPGATWATGGAWTEGPNTEIAIRLELQRLAPGANRWDYVWDETRQANGVRSFSWMTNEINCGPGEYRWYMTVKFGTDPNTTYFAYHGGIILQ